MPTSGQKFNFYHPYNNENDEKLLRKEGGYMVSGSDIVSIFEGFFSGLARFIIIVFISGIILSTSITYWVMKPPNPTQVKEQQRYQKVLESLTEEQKEVLKL